MTGRALGSVLRVSFRLVLALVLFGCGDRVQRPDSHEVSVDPRSGEVEVETGQGTTTVTKDGKRAKLRTVDGRETSVDSSTRIIEDDLGLPFFPSSTDTGESARVTRGDLEMVTSVRTTLKSVADVAAFYNGKLKVMSDTVTADRLVMSGKFGERQFLLHATRLGKVTKIVVASTRLPGRPGW